MKQAITLLALLTLLLAAPATLPAGHVLSIEITHWCGSTDPQAADSQVVTSYQLAPIFQGPIEVKPESDLAAQLKKTFNLPKLFPIMNATIDWDSTKEKEIEKSVMIGGSEYLTTLSPVSLNGSYKFHIRIAIKGSGAQQKHLVDSEIVLTEKQPVVIGFRGEERGDMRHFLSLRILKASETAGDAASPLRVSSNRRPKLISRVAPVYPQEAIDKHLEGIVIVEATSDETGRVKALRVTNEIDPLLSGAAIEAVRQWKFEPYILDGKAKPVIFTVTVTFSLQDGSEPMVTKLSESQKPEVIKKVNPVYPEKAMKAGIQGTVVLEATTGITGAVTAVRVIKGIPELNEAAVDAVRQWQYKPYRVDGKAKPVSFTVTVTFHLDQKKK